VKHFKRLNSAGHMMDPSIINCRLVELTGSRLHGFLAGGGDRSGLRKQVRTKLICRLSRLGLEGGQKNSPPDFRPIIGDNPALALRKIHAIVEPDRESVENQGPPPWRRPSRGKTFRSSHKNIRQRTVPIGRARAGRERPMEDNNVDPV